MSSELLDRLQAINPENVEDVAPDELAAVFSTIEDKRAVVDPPSRRSEHTGTKRNRWRPAFAFAAATLLVLLLVAIPSLLRSESEPLVDQPPSTIPPTSVPEPPPATTVATNPTVSAPAITWTQLPPGPVFAEARLMSVVAGGPGLVASGASPEGPLWVSRDGETWERVPISAIESGHDASIHRLTSGPFGLIGLGEVEGAELAVWQSDDATSWQRIDNGALAGANPRVTAGGVSQAPSVAQGPAGIVVVGSIDNRPAVWYYSSDTASWTLVDDSAFVGDEELSPYAVEAAGQGWVIVGGAGPSSISTGDGERPAAWMSTNGLDWERLPDDQETSNQPYVETGGRYPPGPTPMLSVESLGTRLIGIGRDGIEDPHAAVWLSDDGLSWRRVYAGPLHVPWTFLHGVAGSGDRVVIVGRESTATIELSAVWISDDRGETWHRIDRYHQAFLTGGVLNAVTWLNGTIVAVGEGEDGAKVLTGTRND